MAKTGVPHALAKIAICYCIFALAIVVLANFYSYFNVSSDWQYLMEMVTVSLGNPWAQCVENPCISVHLMCTQCVDGCMYCIAAGAPNYFPNSFAGPEDDLKHANHPQNVRERGGVGGERGGGGGGGGGGMGMEEGGEEGT